MVFGAKTGVFMRKYNCILEKYRVILDKYSGIRGENIVVLEIIYSGIWVKYNDILRTFWSYTVVCGAKNSGIFQQEQWYLGQIK